MCCKMEATFAIKLVIFATVLLQGSAFKVQISHFNDVSGQLDSFKRGTSNSSNAPQPCSAETDIDCIGGMARTVHWLNEPLDGNPINWKFIISSGNIIGGESGWLPSINGGWKRYAEVVQTVYKPNILAVGMKEFGAGVQALLNFTELVPNVAVLANTCEGSVVGENEKKFCSNATLVSKIRELTVSDETSTEFKIGVIGFVTPTVERLSIPGRLKFSDVVSSIRQVVDQHSGIKTFIATGDGNLDLAREIINQVPKVKLVIYGAGFSNTRDMTNEYPMKHNDGYIVTAGRYGSSIGKLIIDIDSNTGNIRSATGKIIETVMPAQYNNEGNFAASNMKTLRQDIIKAQEKLNIYTRVTLEGGEKCWRQECNLGNLMTDAMVHCALQMSNSPYDFHIHSIWHSGAFFNDKIEAGRQISMFDIHKWLPYHNKAYLVSIKGSDLMNVFQASATGIKPEQANAKDWRQFLQVSNGLEVYYDTLSEGGPKVSKVRMTHDFDGVPALTDLRMDETYHLVIPTYLYEGRGVYDFIAWKWGNVTHDNVEDNRIGFDDDCLLDYVQRLKHISVGFEERIWIDGNPSARPVVPDTVCPGRRTGLTVILTIVFFTLFLAIIYVGFVYVLPRLRRSNSNIEYPPNQL